MNKRMKAKYLSGMQLSENGAINPLYGKELIILPDGAIGEIVDAPAQPAEAFFFNLPPNMQDEEKQKLLDAARKIVTNATE